MICERLLKLCGRHKVFSTGIMKENNSGFRRDVAINFQLDKSESFCKYFFSSANSGAELNRRQRPDSNNTIALTSGIVSPETEFTELERFSSNSERRRTESSKTNHKMIESNPRSGLPPVEETGFNREILNLSAPMHQIDSVGLETPKKSRASSGSHSSDEPLESSLSESLTSLIESLGYRVLKIDSSQMLHEQEFELLNNRNINHKTNYEINDTILDNDDYYNDTDSDESLDAQCSSGFISTNCGNSTEDDDDCETVDQMCVIRALLSDYNSYNKHFKHALLIYQVFIILNI